MDSNPYSRFADMIKNPKGGTSSEKKGGTLLIRRGTVLTVSPLVIDVEGITASGSELMINASLLPHSESFVPTGMEPPNFEASVTPKLETGDTLLLLTEDDQLFNILCKVVTA